MFGAGETTKSKRRLHSVNADKMSSRLLATETTIGRRFSITRTLRRYAHKLSNRARALARLAGTVY